jgi:hypothetical protein
MTLILTHISRHGIIHASDSNLTAADSSPAGKAKKTFRLPKLRAGLTIAGSYSVGGVPMDRWMNLFISQHTVSAGSLKAFAYALGKSLESEMLREEKEGGSMVHIAGYVRDKGCYHPEFYFVRNVHGIASSGEYTDIRNDFAVSEDFWTRDCPRGNLMEAFQRDVYQLYINGFPEGRIGYLGLQAPLTKFFSDIWSRPAWRFRPPRTVYETAEFLKLYMNVIATLFRVSDYPARFIGGRVQLLQIVQPKRVATSC